MWRSGHITSNPAHLIQSWNVFTQFFEHCSDTKRFAAAALGNVCESGEWSNVIGRVGKSTPSSSTDFLSAQIPTITVIADIKTASWYVSVTTTSIQGTGQTFTRWTNDGTLKVWGSCSPCQQWKSIRYKMSNSTTMLFAWKSLRKPTEQAHCFSPVNVRSKQN